MSVVGIKHAQSHATFVADRSGHHYTAPYIVTTDSARTGPRAIVDYIGNVVGRGISTTFRYADESDVFAFCNAIKPVRRASSQKVWDVTLEYSTKKAEDPEQPEWRDEDGKPTQDPFRYRGDIKIATQSVQAPVWKAWNVDPFLGGSYRRGANVLGAVTNSAGTVLDPPLMQEVPETIISTTSHAAGWDADWALGNVQHINTMTLQYTPYVLSAFNIAQKQFDAYTIRCTGLQGAFQESTDQNGETVRYWKVTQEFRIRARADLINPFDGWLDTVLDRGLSRTADDGDPDGHGGTFSTDDFEAGMSQTVGIRGIDGGRVGEPVLLNGAGQPLKLLPGSDADVGGIYFRWRKQPESTFSNMAWPIFEVV